MTANSFDLLTETRTMADLTIGGQVTPPALAVSANDYNPAHAPVAGVLCVSASSAVNITGMAAPAFPLVRHLINVGANTITLTKQDAASLAANRFEMGGASHALLAGQGAAIYYHLGIARWVLLHESTSGVIGTDPDAIHDNVAGEINAIALKGSPVAADVLVLEDSAAGFVKKRVLVAALGGGGGDPCITRTVSSSLAIAADTTCLQRRPLIAAGVSVTIEATGEWLIL